MDKATIRFIGIYAYAGVQQREEILASSQLVAENTFKAYCKEQNVQYVGVYNPSKDNRETVEGSSDRSDWR